MWELKKTPESRSWSIVLVNVCEYAQSEAVSSHLDMLVVVITLIDSSTCLRVIVQLKFKISEEEFMTIYGLVVICKSNTSLSHNDIVWNKSSSLDVTIHNNKNTHVCVRLKMITLHTWSGKSFMCFMLRSFIIVLIKRLY